MSHQIRLTLAIGLKCQVRGKIQRKEKRSPGPRCKYCLGKTVCLSVTGVLQDLFKTLRVGSCWLETQNHRKINCFQVICLQRYSNSFLVNNQVFFNLWYNEKNVGREVGKPDVIYPSSRPLQSSECHNKTSCNFLLMEGLIFNL